MDVGFRLRKLMSVFVVVVGVLRCSDFGCGVAQNVRLLLRM